MDPFGKRSLLLGYSKQLMSRNWKVSHAETTGTTHSRLLDDLPVDIILDIADLLGPADYILFSHTSRATRRILEHRYTINSLTRSEYLKYLAAITRTLPKYWLCYYCAKLHHISTHDTPNSKHIIPSNCFCARIGIRIRWTSHPRPIWIEHHHAQLALKYARLNNPKYYDYLQALMRPLFHQYTDARGQGASLTTRYSVYPRIIRGSNGQLRFLTLSTWKFIDHRDSNGQASTCVAPRPIKLCPHLNFDPHHSSNHALNTSQSRALTKRPGHRSRSTWCTRCGTDISVRRSTSTKLVTLRAWQDFGPEGVPKTCAWEHASTVDLRDRGAVQCLPWYGPPNPRARGTIRSRYGQPPRLSRGLYRAMVRDSSPQQKPNPTQPNSTQR
ncbi:hypothetical protein GGR50DRAFT_697548 [Xylaria sp. CBS 124048]|nr:hypothetical protein GGR50DRAFT_697548 [Xylaria sp. CBS 124048]